MRLWIIKTGDGIMKLMVLIVASLICLLIFNSQTATQTTAVTVFAVIVGGCLVLGTFLAFSLIEIAISTNTIAQYLTNRQRVSRPPVLANKDRTYAFCVVYPEEKAIDESERDTINHLLKN